MQKWRTSKKLNAHGRPALRVKDVPQELRELPKKGLRELFRNTQHYEPQISEYLKSRFFDSYEAFRDNKCPALHLEEDFSGNMTLTLGKIERPDRESIILDYVPTLEHKFQVPQGIDENEVFLAEERALLMDFEWISGCIIKHREKKYERSNTI